MAAKRSTAPGGAQSEAVGHDVEEVIGVQVRDQHRVDRGVVDDRAQLGEHAVAAVEQQREPVVLDQVSTARAGSILP
jgi:hypothetical protein